MPISDAQYKEWLLDSTERVVLVEYSYYEFGLLKTGYAANTPYVSRPTDTPANTPYDEIVSQDIFIKRSVSHEPSEASARSYGDIVIFLNDDLENLVYCDFKDCEIKVLIGDMSWDRNDFRLKINGIISSATLSKRQLTFRVSDSLSELNKPFNRGIMSNKVMIPILFGDCINITPALTPTSLTYRFSHLSNFIIAYDEGVEVTSTNNLDGSFTLAAPPVGVVTASNTPSLKSAANCIGQVITRYVPSITWAGRVQTMVESLDDISIAEDDHSGFYITDEEYTPADLITLFASLYNESWYIDEEGEFQICGYKSIFSEEGESIDFDMIVEDSVSYKDSVPAVYKIDGGCVKNWTTQSSFATSLSEEEKAALQKEYMNSYSATNATTLTNYPNAIRKIVNLNVINSFLELKDRVDNFYNTPKIIYTIQIIMKKILKLGWTTTIDYDGFGFDKTKEYSILSIDENISTGQATIEVICDKS